MELKLSSDDVKAILIEWAQSKFPSVQFNDADWSGYSYSREITLSYVGPSESDEPALKAA